jgi:hypothetical protein
MTSSKATLGGVALPEITSFVGNEGAVSALHYTTSASPGISPSPCPRYISPGTPLHHQRFSCGQCWRWLRWLPRPRPVAQEGQR